MSMKLLLLEEWFRHANSSEGKIRQVSMFTWLTLTEAIKRLKIYEKKFHEKFPLSIVEFRLLSVSILPDEAGLSCVLGELQVEDLVAVTDPYIKMEDPKLELPDEKH